MQETSTGSPTLRPRRCHACPDGSIPGGRRGFVEIADAIETAFAAVKAQQPEGIRYAYLRRSGSTEFVALLELDEGENPRPGIEAARRLQATVAKWAVGPAPRPQPLELLGTYRMLD
jgi:hypothetical protein